MHMRIPFDCIGCEDIGQRRPIAQELHDQFERQRPARQAIVGDIDRIASKQHTHQVPGNEARQPQQCGDRSAHNATGT